MLAILARESEIPEPGDGILKPLGVDPVIVARDEHGGIRVLANACRYRGVALRLAEVRERVSLPLAIPRVDLCEHR